MLVMKCLFYFFATILFVGTDDSLFHFRKRSSHLFPEYYGLLISLSMGKVEPAQTKPINQLSDQKRKEGWKLLFDGKSLKGWRGYKESGEPISWEVRDESIYCNDKPGPDLISLEKYGDFELALEWKISAGGNSGIHLRATEATPDTASNALEIQVIDTSEGWKKVHGYALGAGQEAGALYGLFPAKKEAIRQAGEWNQVKVMMIGNRLQVEQNGVEICNTDMTSNDWKTRIGKSKFAGMAHFNKALEGHVVLQNYRGAGVWYRNIMIRPIKQEPVKP